MLHLYTTLFYQPLFNLLVWIYNILPTHDMGLAIILLTILVKVLLFPFTWKQLKAQEALQEMQPKLDGLKEQYKDDKQGLVQAQMALFKEHKVNPASSCLPLLIQFPFLIALYRVFISGLNSKSLELLYPFVYNPEHLGNTLLGILPLHTANIPLAVLAAGVQFWQGKMMLAKRPPKNLQKLPGAKDEDMAAMMSKQMMYMMPMMTLFLGTTLPAGLVLYWFMQTILTIGQQYLIKVIAKKKPMLEEIAKVS